MELTQENVEMVMGEDFSPREQAIMIYLLDLHRRDRQIIAFLAGCIHGAGLIATVWLIVWVIV